MGTRKNRLVEAVLTSTHNPCFSRSKKISEFLSENFQYLVVKFSVYLNRCVFIMRKIYGTCTDSQLPVFTIQSTEYFYRVSTQEQWKTAAE